MHKSLSVFLKLGSVVKSICEHFTNLRICFDPGRELGGMHEERLVSEGQAEEVGQIVASKLILERRGLKL